MECNSESGRGLHGDAAAYDAFIKKDRDSIPWICVEGYKTSLPTEKIKRLLTKHFSSCGRITDVYIPSDNKSCAYIYIAGVNSAKKAMELNGTEVGGRRIVACVSHLPLNKTITNEGPYGSTGPGPQRSLFTLGSTVPGQREQKALRALYTLGSSVPGPYGYTLGSSVPGPYGYTLGSTVPGPYGYGYTLGSTVPGPYGYTVPGPDTFGSGSTVPGPYGYTVPGPDTFGSGSTVPGPYGYTLPGQRTLYTLGSDTTVPGPYGYTVPGQRIVAEAKKFPLPEVAGYTLGNGTTFGSGSGSDIPAKKAVELSGSEVGGRKIVACVSHLPRNNTITDCGPYGNTVPAGCSKKAEKMTEA